MNAHPPASARTSSPRFKTWGFLGVIVLAGLVWWIQRTRPFTSGSDRTDPMPEVSRAALEVKDGRLHQIGFATPFTGWMMETYPDGSQQSRSSISNGLLHGLSEGRYTNGLVQITEQFHQGVSHGVRTKHRADGSKLSESTIVEGVLHGLFRRWHPNGALAEEVLMKDGKPDGPSLAYFPSGFLKARVLMSNGIVVEETRWKDGEEREVRSESSATASASTAGIK